MNEINNTVGHGSDEELKEIRLTDNSVREGDGVQPPQDPTPLVIGEDGLPVGVKVGVE